MIIFRLQTVRGILTTKFEEFHWHKFIGFIFSRLILKSSVSANNWNIKFLFNVKFKYFSRREIIANPNAIIFPARRYRG